MAKRAPVPFDPSELPRYVESELQRVDQELVTYQTKEYIPDWIGSGISQPSYGNADVKARYYLSNDICEVWFYLKMGSTTTYGSAGASWSFGLPVQARDFRQIGEFHCLDFSTLNQYTGIVEVSRVAPDCSPIITGLGALAYIQPSVPFTWAQSDEMKFHARYLR